MEKHGPYFFLYQCGEFIKPDIESRYPFGSHEINLPVAITCYLSDVVVDQTVWIVFLGFVYFEFMPVI